MIYRFGPFELDLARGELREDGKTCHLEPQVFTLLVLLVEQRDRLVSKDEIVETVWEGRVVSEAALSSRIKSARKALGDDGRAQRFIKTMHGRGFRFVAEVEAPEDQPETRSLATIGGADVAGEPDVAPPAPNSRPSIAVLPFLAVGAPSPYAPIAEALPHELITELSRLRWLLVTARGSSFRLLPDQTDPVEVGRLLGVRYCLGGTVQATGDHLEVTVELSNTGDAGILWADRFSAPVDEVHRVRAEITARILAMLEIQIPLHEAAQARLTMPESLDAWSAYHLGLQQVYRFDRSGNEQAAAYFEQAVAHDPGFARAHAGLSFVHFQSAFLAQTDDPSGARILARRFAERGIELDPMDPFVNFAMGRTHWLNGDLEGSLGWLERATSISPSYAQGLYACAWTESLSGRGQEARDHVDLAMRLSPLDPLYYAMLGTRAFTHMGVGEDALAADWAERAARSPGAHVLIAMIAVAAHAMASRDTLATSWSENVRSRDASLTREDFFRSFPMQSDALRSRVSHALARFDF